MSLSLKLTDDGAVGVCLAPAFHGAGDVSGAEWGHVRRSGRVDDPWAGTSMCGRNIEVCWPSFVA